MDRAAVDWRLWRRILPSRNSQNEEEEFLRLDILSLKSSLIHTREKSLTGQELSSKDVKDLWKIGCDVLRRYKFGNECIAMMGILAYFHPIAIDIQVFGYEYLQYINQISMLKDLGFLTIRRIQLSGATLISTEFTALTDEIRQKNFSVEVNFLGKIMEHLISSRTLLRGYGWKWRDASTPIWKHALTHSRGIKFIRDYNQVWEYYLYDLLQPQSNNFNDEEKEVLNRALEIFGVEYGNMGWKTMELRFTQFRLFLRQDLRINEDVETLLNHSWHYRSLLETCVIDNVLIPGYVPNSSGSKQLFIAEWIYAKALEMLDGNSKTLLLQEALAYCVLGNNVWRHGIPDKDGDVCFGVKLQCLNKLGRWNEMVAYTTEIREILIRHPFSLDMYWFPQSILEKAQEIEENASKLILNELSTFLNHFYNTGGMGFREDQNILEWLIRYGVRLGKWDSILVIMREKRELWRAHIIGGGVQAWVELESTLFNLIKNSTNGIGDELVNESLEFMKQLVEFLINDGAYGERYIGMMPSYYSNRDPLVQVIIIFLVKSRHEELLSYMLEYEKLLEDKYGGRIGPVTNGMFLFGRWLTRLLEFQMNIGNKLEELLEGVKAMTQNRMSIMSNHPAQMEPRMEVFAHMISSKCDYYLTQI